MLRALLLTSIIAIFSAQCPAFADNIRAKVGFPCPKDGPFHFTDKGKYMTADGSIYSDTGGLGGGNHIRVEYKVHNASSSKAFYSVYIVFFDKNWNLIGSDGFTQIFGQDPGKTDNHGTDIYLPTLEMAKIAAYQVTFYDDNNVVGRQ